MSTAAEHLRFTADDYLAWEAMQPDKHEYLRGEVFAMTGTTDRHNEILLNCVVALRPQLQHSPCRLYAADVKLRVEAADAFFYPDVMVTCSAADAADPLAKRDPVLLVEVLSPATAAYDRGDKFAAYRKLPGLREYLLVDTDSRRCDLYRKGGDGLWVLHPFEPGQALRLESVALDLPASLLWAEVPGATG